MTTQTTAEKLKVLNEQAAILNAQRKELRDTMNAGRDGTLAARRARLAARKILEDCKRTASALMLTAFRSTFVNTDNSEYDFATEAAAIQGTAASAAEALTQYGEDLAAIEAGDIPEHLKAPTKQGDVEEATDEDGLGDDDLDDEV